MQKFPPKPAGARGSLCISGSHLDPFSGSLMDGGGGSKMLKRQAAGGTGAVRPTT